MNPRVRIEVEATAGSDLLLRDSQRRDNVMTSHDYIPGSAIRGHLAARWLARHGGPDEAFHQAFDRGLVTFSHANPLVEGRLAIPAPLTLRTCKTHRLGPGHLAASTAFAADVPSCPHASHGEAGGSTRRVQGYVTADGHVLGPGALRVVRTRIGTTDDPLGRGVAADGALFTESRLAAGTQFTIRIEGRQDLVEQLRDLLDPDGDVVTVGRARTVMGRLETGASTDPVEILPVEPAGGDVHTLTFVSDTVLLDRLQRSVVALGDPAVLASTLASELGVDVSADHLDVLPGTQVRPTLVGGWDAQDRGPKPTDIAVAAGSTIAFRVRSPELIAALARAPRLGWRRAEGFGEVALDHPVHRVERLHEAARHSVRPDDRRSTIARKALDVAGSLRKGGLTRTAWQGIEATVRGGRDLEPDERRAAASKHAQSRSGRGAGAGDRRRATRNDAIEALQTAADELGIEMVSADAALLADDIGRELDLLDLEARRSDER